MEIRRKRPKEGNLSSIENTPKRAHIHPHMDPRLTRHFFPDPTPRVHTYSMILVVNQIFGKLTFTFVMLIYKYHYRVPNRSIPFTVRRRARVDRSGTRTESPRSRTIARGLHFVNRRVWKQNSTNAGRAEIDEGKFCRRIQGKSKSTHYLFHYKLSFRQ